MCDGHCAPHVQVRAKNVILQGNSPSISQIFDITIDRAREFNDTDSGRRAPVVMLGYDTTMTLMRPRRPGRQPISSESP
jgi:hypothetical protein